MLTIHYCFRFEDGRVEDFAFQFDPETMDQIPARSGTLAPHWASLAFHRCGNCPLADVGGGDCPPAAKLAEVFPRLGNLPSFETVDLEVTTDERTVTIKTTLSEGLRSLIGLIMGTSDCPHMRGFRPMARFHLPLSSDVETLYRVTSSYLLGQYFQHRDGDAFDVEMTGLLAFYGNVQTVNAGFADRMRASGALAEINPIANLYMQSETVPFSIQDRLAELAPLFGRTT